jgi:hypothetical protein
VQSVNHQGRGFWWVVFAGNHLQFYHGGKSGIACVLAVENSMMMFATVTEYHPGKVE